MRAIIDFFTLLLISMGFYGGFYFVIRSQHIVIAIFLLTMSFVLGLITSFYEITFVKTEEKKQRKVKRRIPNESK